MLLLLLNLIIKIKVIHIILIPYLLIPLLFIVASNPPIFPPLFLTLAQLPHDPLLFALHLLPQQLNKPP